MTFYGAKTVPIDKTVWSTFAEMSTSSLSFFDGYWCPDIGSRNIDNRGFRALLFGCRQPYARYRGQRPNKAFRNTRQRTRDSSSMKVANDGTPDSRDYRQRRDRNWTAGRDHS